MSREEDVIHFVCDDDPVRIQEAKARCTFQEIAQAYRSKQSRRAGVGFATDTSRRT